MARLTGRQRAFVEEYLRDFNATRAAIAAGYSARSATVIGCENLTKPNISAAIKQAIAERIMSADEVKLRLADIARGDMGDFLDINSMSFAIDLARAKDAGKTKLIKKVKQKTVTRIEKDGTEQEDNTIEIELYDAQAALNSLGKHLGLFKDTHEVEIRAPGLEDVLRRVYGA